MKHLLLLSCLLLCSTFVHATDDEEDIIIDKTSLVLNTRRELLIALEQACKEGVEQLKELLDRPEVSDLVDKSTGFDKEATQRIIDYHRKKLNYFLNLDAQLAAAARVGRDALKLLLEDPTIRETIKRMFYKVQPLGVQILKHYEEVLTRMSEKKETSYSILPRVGVNLQQFEDLIKLVVDARKRGTSIQNIVESNEFKDALEKLPQFLRKLVLLQVRIAEAVEKRRGGTNAYFIEDIAKHLKTMEEIIDMYNHFKDGNRRDKIEIMNFFESAEGKALVQSLPEVLRKPFDLILPNAFQRFREELAKENAI